MKEKVYDRTTCEDIVPGKCRMKFNVSTGQITFPGKVIRMMGISYESMVEFVQDADRPQNWYIRKTIRLDGFAPEQKDTKYGTTYLFIRAGNLPETIAKSLGLDWNSFFIPLQGDKGTGLFRLDTSAASHK